jgi:hypothetical protein
MFSITGAEIDQIKKNYVESQSRRTSKLKGLGDELQGVHKVMFDNIDAVLQRGELISGKLKIYIFEEAVKLMVLPPPLSLPPSMHRAW